MNIIEKLQKAIILEKQAEIEYFENLIHQKSLQERVNSGISFYPIQLKEEKIGAGNQLILEFQSDSFLNSKAKLQNGQVVSIFTLQELPKKEAKSFKAVLLSIYKNTIKVMPYSSELPDWIEEGKLGIDLYFDETSYVLMEKALEKLKEKGSPYLEQIKRIVWGKEKLHFSDTYEISIPHLNSSQKAAVMKIMTAKELAIVHGPPGTGKTTTLTEAIYYLVKNQNKVLVCAASNTATDLLAQKISQKGIKVLRLGHPARMDPEIWNLTLDAVCEKQAYFPQIQELRKRALLLKNEALKFKRNYNFQDKLERKETLKEVRALQNEAWELEKNIVKNVLEETQVICCTLTGSENEYLSTIIFDVLVIDEAAQALEPACLIAIPKAKKWILAGDHHQLPPTVKSIEAEKMGLSVTLFEKLIEKYPEASVMLNTQYRANEKIMEFSSQMFYQNQLNAHESVKNYALSPDEPVITFLDTAGCGFSEILHPENLSYYNPEEARILIRYLKQLLENHPNVSIGIISPYKQQVKLLEELVSQEELLKNSKVDPDKLRIFMEDSENMSPQLKEKLMAEQGSTNK
jgi:superfamily I DNA and/or RNA helicase